MRNGTPRRLGAAFALALTAVLVLGAFAPAQAQNRRHQMLQLINDELQDRGIGRIGLDRDLSAYAREHSQDMEQKDKLFHSDSLTTYLPRAWSSWGENVGVGVTVRGLHNAFMRSDDHRANVLYRGYDRIGIGFARTPDDILWVTVVFYG